MGQTITDIMPRLIPALMTGMVYSTEAQENFSVENAENEAEVDRIEDIRPIFHKNRAASGGAGGDGAEEDEDDDGGDDDGEAGGQWTMRKCSAHALDTLSATFQGDIILPSMLPGGCGWKFGFGFGLGLLFGNHAATPQRPNAPTPQHPNAPTPQRPNTATPQHSPTSSPPQSCKLGSVRKICGCGRGRFCRWGRCVMGRGTGWCNICQRYFRF